MANIFVVFSKIMKNKDGKSYMLIDQGTCNQMEKSITFSVNEIIEEDIDTLMHTLAELMICKLNFAKNDPEYNRDKNFVVFVSLKEEHFKIIKEDQVHFDEFRSNLEEELFNKRIENPNVIFHKEDDFSRIIGKEKIFSARIPAYENVTYPYPKDLIQDVEKFPELLELLFSSA